ncbi:MAG: methyltransferase [Bacteroidota bacterium]
METSTPTMTDEIKENRLQISHFIYGNWLNQVTYVFAELALADAFVNGPQTLEQLAEFGGVQAPYLKRVLRATFELTFLTFDVDTQLYHLTEMGAMLGSNHPFSMREEARLNGAHYRYQPWGNLIHILRNGPKDEYSPTMKNGSLDYLKDKPELLNTFHETLNQKSKIENKAIVKDYDFSQFNKVMDIGCGRGSFIMSILDQNPELEGYMFDLEATLDFDIPEKYSNRLHKAPGDFFVEVPGVADVYTMKMVIHNWPEDKVVKILESVRDAMKSTDKIGVDPSKKRLLIIENLLVEHDEPKIATWMDINFMVIIGGAEHTLEEYRVIGRKAGLELSEVVETSSGRHVLAFALAE